MTPEPNTGSLGEYLRGERERRGITIEQVASATKIGVKLLHALEGDQFGELPAKPFIRGFVTSYARFIGLNPSEVLTRFAEFIDRKSQERPVRDAGHSGYAFERREGDNSRTMLWMIMGGIGVIGGVALLFMKPSHRSGTHLDKLKKAHAPTAAVSAVAPSSPSPIPSEAAVAMAPTGSPVPAASAPAVPVTTVPVTTTPVTTAPAPAASPTAQVAAAATPAPSPSASLAPGEKPDALNSGVNLKPAQIKHKLILKATEDVRIRYQVDERPVMSFILREGRILVLRAEREVRFQATRANALTLNYNSSGEKPIEGSKYLTTRQGDPTLLFPMQLADSVQDPFPGTRPLTGR